MADPVTDPTLPEPQELVAEDLIEEVSIDGMCGVY
jgi:mycofactocin precursor